MKRLFVLALLAMPAAHANVNIVDKDDWKIGIGGFMESDMIFDSTRSLLESPGNSPIDLHGTPAGDHGRTQGSVRNSRVLLDVRAPAYEGWNSIPRPQRA